MAATADGSPPDRAEAPDWPIRPPGVSADQRVSLPAVLWSREATGWYTGGTIALLWLISIAQDVVQASPTAGATAAGLGLVVVFAVAFLVSAPLAWALPVSGRLAVCGGLFALTFSLFPWLGWGIAGTWTYVGVIIAMCVFPWRITWPLIFGLGVLALLTGALSEGWTEDILWLPAIIVSISLMMAAFARTTAAMNQLRATQAQLEELAVERERGRVARDIHDILGHSLPSSPSSRNSPGDWSPWTRSAPEPRSPRSRRSRGVRSPMCAPRWQGSGG